MLLTRTMVSAQVLGTCLDEHVQVMSGKACQKRKDLCM